MYKKFILRDGYGNKSIEKIEHYQQELSLDNINKIDSGQIKFRRNGVICSPLLLGAFNSYFMIHAKLLSLLLIRCQQYVHAMRPPTPRLQWQAPV